jgi:hypothetical protein
MLPRTNEMWWGTSIEAPDPGALATFYSQLLGWTVVHEESGTVVVAPPEGSIYVVFQQATGYERPVAVQAGRAEVRQPCCVVFSRAHRTARGTCGWGGRGNRAGRSSGALVVLGGGA